MAIRTAREEDASALSTLVQRAYGGYVELIGRRPAPMDEDYAARIREADVFVAEEHGQLTGLIVCVAAHAIYQRLGWIETGRRRTAGFARAYFTKRLGET